MCGQWCLKKNKGILTFYFKHFVFDTFKQYTNTEFFIELNYPSQNTIFSENQQVEEQC